MKKLEEDETIKDKGEQTRAADCTLPQKAKNVQNMPKNAKNIQNMFQQSKQERQISHYQEKCQKRSKSEFKTCSSLF